MRRMRKKYPKRYDGYDVIGTICTPKGPLRSRKLGPPSSRPPVPKCPAYQAVQGSPPHTRSGTGSWATGRHSGIVHLLVFRHLLPSSPGARCDCTRTGDSRGSRRQHFIPSDPTTYPTYNTIHTRPTTEYACSGSIDPTPTNQRRRAFPITARASFLRSPSFVSRSSPPRLSRRLSHRLLVSCCFPPFSAFIALSICSGQRIDDCFPLCWQCPDKPAFRCLGETRPGERPIRQHHITHPTHSPGH